MVVSGGLVGRKHCANLDGRDEASHQVAIGLWALSFGRSGVGRIRIISGGSGGPGAGWCRISGWTDRERVRDGGGESKGEGRRLCTEGSVSRDVGMRTKITGTACDVSSSRLVWVWVWVWVWAWGWG